MNDVIYNILTRDFRTSLWQGFSTDYGSMCHIRSYELRLTYSHEDDYHFRKAWESELPMFRKNFGIPEDERIIYHRDNTFWSEDHNQGLVITDEKIYFIEDNDYPEDRMWFSWGTIKEVVYDDYELIFHFKDGDILPINMKYFSKRHDYCKKRTVIEMGKALQDVFNYIISIVG